MIDPTSIIEKINILLFNGMALCIPVCLVSIVILGYIVLFGGAASLVTQGKGRREQTTTHASSGSSEPSGSRDVYDDDSPTSTRLTLEELEDIDRRRDDDTLLGVAIETTAKGFFGLFRNSDDDE